MSQLISISEIFGPTVQGEGAMIGTPTIFVRTGGCDYRCQWCDTHYAVLPEFADQWQSLSTTEVWQKIQTLSQHQPLWITLSGGNPAQQPLGDLIKQGQNAGYRFSMETQGSIYTDWLVELDQLTLSPKPPSSGMAFKHKALQKILADCQNKVDIALKLVVADQQDLEWARDIATQYPTLACYLQPCNAQQSLFDWQHNQAPDNQQLQQRYLWLQQAALAMAWHDVRILPQLHVWLWGNVSGV